MVKVGWVLSSVPTGIFPLYPSSVRHNNVEYKQKIARILWHTLQNEFSEALSQLSNVTAFLHGQSLAIK